MEMNIHQTVYFTPYTGLAGLAIGKITEHYTGTNTKPVKS